LHFLIMLVAVALFSQHQSSLSPRLCRRAFPPSPTVQIYPLGALLSHPHMPAFLLSIPEPVPSVTGQVQGFYLPIVFVLSPPPLFTVSPWLPQAVVAVPSSGIRGCFFFFCRRFPPAWSLRWATPLPFEFFLQNHSPFFPVLFSQPLPSRDRVGARAVQPWISSIQRRGITFPTILPTSRDSFVAHRFSPFFPLNSFRLYLAGRPGCMGFLFSLNDPCGFSPCPPSQHPRTMVG